MNFYIGTCFLISHNDTAQKIIKKTCDENLVKVLHQYTLFTCTKHRMMMHIHIHILSDNGQFFATAYKEVIKVSKGMLTNPLFLPFR